jgi:hypothetical protein
VPARVIDSTDPAAGDIVARAAAALAALAVTTVERFAGPATLPVVLAGGLSGSTALADAVRRAVTVALAGTEFHVLAQPPVAGAVHLARRAAGKGAAGA